MRKCSAVLVIAATLAIGCEGMPVHQVSRSAEGAYDVETRYDMKTLSGAFSGLAGDWAQPDRAINRQIVSTVRSQYGDNVANAFVSVYGDELQSDIRAYLNEEAPPWVMNLQSGLEGVDKQLGTVDMQSAWLISETSEGQLEATQIFDGIAVFRDPDCPDSDALVCDQLEITSQELLDSEYPVEVLSGKYTATETDESLYLESHGLAFNYGRLGLYVLVNTILPDDPTEGVGLRDLALAAINCRGLAGRLAGEDSTLGVEVGGVNVGLSLQDLIGSCEEGVLAQVNSFVDRFHLPVDMNLTGNAQIVDTNRDGRIDQFTSGNVDGNMQWTMFNGREDSGPVGGVFTGFRVGDVD